ncbi:unnamed protein product [Gongylonema pulchrum]|uniref:GCV_T_C domain-containing protein n=1 Tax=Gongylonema pulchrum TaxID=637853 RepID=A0A183DQJ7_9BILA|nr:unnamed protein product [Gongylonema pulchrum]
MDVGKSYGIVNFGQSTLNMMRIEHGYKIWGREVLVICEPLTELQGWRTVPKRMEVIRKEGSEDRVGQITSGTYSVRLNRPLAFAWVHMDITPEDKSVLSQCRLLTWEIC